MAERRKEKGGKKKLCQKKEKQEKCCDKPKGGRGLSSTWRVCFFPNNLDTTVLTKDVQRPVCTDEMRNFVIPTLSIFQNLLCPVVFLLAGILSSGGLQSEMETVFGVLLLSRCLPPPPHLSPSFRVVLSTLRRCSLMDTMTKSWTDSFPVPSPIAPRSLSLCPFLIVASDLRSQGHFRRVISALCKQAGQGDFLQEKKKYL